MRRLGNLLVREEVVACGRCQQWRCEQRGTHYVFLKSRHAVGVYCRVDARDWLKEGGVVAVRARKRFDKYAVRI
jgi:hypothetical protein